MSESQVAPHDCPVCSSPAYVPLVFGRTRCTNVECENFNKALHEEWLDESCEGEDAVEFELDVEEASELPNGARSSSPQSANDNMVDMSGYDASLVRAVRTIVENHKDFPGTTDALWGVPEHEED